MPSQVDLCNMALDQIGANVTIQSISPPMPAGVAAEVCARNWLLRVDQVMRGAHWNCLRAQKDLTLLKAAVGTEANPSGDLPVPPIPYLYEYEYPADCLLMRFLIPQISQPGTSVPVMSNVGGLQMLNPVTSLPFVPASDVDDDGNNIRVILTNAPMAQGVYTKRLDDPNLWDQGLQSAVTAVLAAWFCGPLAESQGLLAGLLAEAKRQLDMGRMQNGNESITSVDHYPDWMQARGGYGYSDYNGGLGTQTFVASWQAVGLPGLSY